MYQVEKTYGHERGLSACFRQHRADSHCAYLHGYALSFSFKFSSNTLDKNGWVIDFGDLHWLKSALEYQFDHKTLVAKDDPALDVFGKLAEDGLIQLRLVDRTGCEAFAKQMFEFVANALASNLSYKGVRLDSVTVREHGSNAASYGV